MHIKQVNISGFRSFRSQTADIEPFSSKHNVIVGRNGSGKSNFFDAIQFVLVAPKFANLRQEERQNLLHEGAGSSVMAAYVEIVFDNSDGRFSVDSDEVIIRRTIGHKKDEFFLNRKRIQKNEVVSLLESAGFSKSNPYYIVQQGKVNLLCTMKDKDRLNLLKEVAGTTIYEERRAESLKIMEETASKQSKVEEVLAFIEERLSELDHEKEELVEYEKLDKQRRCLEYHLYQHEYNKAQEELNSIEDDRDSIRKDQQHLHSELRQIQDEIFNLEDHSNNLKSTIERLNKRKVTKEEDLAKFQERKASIESSIQDIEMSIKSRELLIDSYSKQLEQIAKQLIQQQEELESLEPAYQAKNQELIQEMGTVNSMKNRIDLLYGKQGRSMQFKTLKDRNNFLNTQIKKLTEQLNRKQSSLDNLKNNIEMDQKRIEEERKILNNLENTDTLKNKNEITNLTNLIHEKILIRNSLQEKRKNNWRELEKIAELLHENRNELDKSKNLLNSVLPHAITQGLAAVEYIVQEKNIKGYYGPVIDNISLKNPKYRQVVETAAGNQLFHVIVDNDKTAAILIHELEARNAGRLTFLPLTRLRLKDYQYPKNTTDVYPLIELAIDYEKEVERAIKLIFGPKLIAKDINVASDYAKSSNMDALTLDGDIVNHRGAFEGGYHDDKLSKILAVEKIRLANEKIALYSEEEEKLKNISEEIDNEITKLIRLIQKLENDRNSLKLLDERQSKEMIMKRKFIHNLTQSIHENEKNFTILTQEISSLQESIQNYENEKNSPLLSNLTEMERNELQNLEENMKNLMKKIELLKSELTILSETRDEIETNIETNLLKRKEELELLLTNQSNNNQNSGETGEENIPLTNAPSSAKKGKKGKQTQQQQQQSSEDKQQSKNDNNNQSFGRDFQSELSNFRSELESLERILIVTQQDYDEITSNILSKSNQILKLENEIENLKEKEKQYHEQLNLISKQLEKLLSKRSISSEIVQSRTKLIRDLGSLPEDKLQEFHKLNENQIIKKLKLINENLKQFTHVNRKALDQYLSFNEQRETLISRREEMNRDTLAIQSLIQSLDLQKDEAINHTFTSVSQHFANVFQELVPNGFGKLIMKTILDEESLEDQEERKALEEQNKSKGNKKKGAATTTATGDHDLTEETSKGISLLPVDSYRGIQVIVSFNKATGENFSMQQLSGGQKALVALALIFAIQRCDPAPFYLFDEIDQALDANYRRAVANLIHRQANSEESPAQFITTTFRPELVEVADRCFGIALTNKVSNLYPLDKDDARDFVTNLMLEEEAVGKAMAVPNFSQSTPSKGAPPKASNSPMKGRNLLAEDEDEEEGGGDDDEEEEEEEEESGRRRKVPAKQRGSSSASTKRKTGAASKGRAAASASSRRKRSHREEEEEEPEEEDQDEEEEDEDAMDLDD